MTKAMAGSTGQVWQQPVAPLAPCFGIGPVVGSVPPISLSNISKLRSISTPQAGPQVVGATGSRNERGPRGLKGRWTDGQLRAGFPRDRPDADRNRWRQGRVLRRAFADRRHSRAGWLLRDDGCLPADHGGSAVHRRTARSAVAPEPG